LREPCTTLDDQTENIFKIDKRSNLTILIVSHDDAASAVVACVNAPGGIYNVCDDEPTTRRAYFDALAELIGARGGRGSRRRAWRRCWDRRGR